MFQALIGITNPTVCVELGVLDGFSTVVIGSILKSLKEGGRIYSYDLFEDYDFKKAKYETVMKTIRDFDLEGCVTLKKANAKDAVKDFKDDSIDFMHVDISNDGGTISDIFSEWDKKIKSGGVIVFEGGSPMRDNIPWMVDYNKTKIFPELKSNKILNRSYTYVVLHQFPSMVVCSKNIDFSDKAMCQYGYLLPDENNEDDNIETDKLLKSLQ